MVQKEICRAKACYALVRAIVNDISRLWVGVIKDFDALGALGLDVRDVLIY